MMSLTWLLCVVSCPLLTCYHFELVVFVVCVVVDVDVDVVDGWGCLVCGD